MPTPLRVLATQNRRRRPPAACAQVEGSSPALSKGEGGAKTRIRTHGDTQLALGTTKKKVMATRTHNTHALLGSIATRFTTLPGPPLSVNT